jgi:copper transport protein
MAQKAPTEARLVFNENVETGFGAVRVYNDQGLRVDRGAVTARGRVVRVGLASALGPGTYVVQWRAVGSDGHVATDSFVFNYQRATTAGVVRPRRDTSGGARGALRWAALFLLALLWGRALFAGGRRRGVAVAAVVAVAALLAADAMSLSGLGLIDALHGSVLGPVVRTTTGTVRLVQLASVGAAVIWPPVAAVTGAVALGAEAWAGHARLAPTGNVALASQALHLLAMGVWVGGLLAVITHRSSTVLRRYRAAAGLAVAVLIVTGTYNGWAEVGRWNRLLATTYGRVLVAKVVLVALVLVVAWVNRRRAALLGLELFGQVAIVALATFLGSMAPARGGAGPVSRVFELGPWRTSFVIDPDQTGANEVHLFLLSGPGQLATDVADARVTVRRDGGPQHDVRLVGAGAGHYASETGALGESGHWVASVAATGKDGRHYAKSIPFVVSP